MFFQVWCEPLQENVHDQSITIETAMKVILSAASSRVIYSGQDVSLIQGHAANTSRPSRVWPEYHCLQIYDLHSFEVLWEKAEDTKALLAWSSERIVLSFRGTASWANVLADLRFWLKGG